MIPIGQKAPDFTLTDKDGVVYSLSKIKTQFTVLYFYPKDNTPGCTLEAKDFTTLRNEFASEGVTVLGISGGDAKTKVKFCSENQLLIPLLSDTDFAVSKAYGVFGERSFMGNKFMGISRTTFIINEQKKAVSLFENVKALGHAGAVLDRIRSLKKVKA